MFIVCVVTAALAISVNTDEKEEAASGAPSSFILPSQS